MHSDTIGKKCSVTDFFRLMDEQPLRGSVTEKSCNDKNEV